MDTTRNTALQRVFRCAEAAFQDAAAPPPGSVALAARVFGALVRAPGVPRPGPAPREPNTLPACAHLPRAIDEATRHGGSTAQLARALAAAAPGFTWERRAGAASEAPDFFDGHANAVLAGPKGLEIRDDVLVGISLMAPRIQYPDHQHPPEEFYVVLSPGQWRQADGAWHEPGPGGVVHNPPGIVHAMRSGEAPLLALWFLWIG